MASLKEIKLWTWRTEEMLELIEWARTFNLSNENQIKFIGCDVQFIDDDYRELQRTLPYTALAKLNIDSVFDELDNDSNDSIIQSRYAQWNALKVKLVNTSNQPAINIQPAHMTGIDQWFEFKLNQNYNFRDSCMARNMSAYLNEK